MDDFINRKKLLDEYDIVHEGPPCGARKLIEEAPAEDVKVVVHAYWEKDLVTGYMSCSNCKMPAPGDAELEDYYESPFCPCCGADMDYIEDVEVCPYCGQENVYPMWNTAEQGFIATCQHCGEEIFLCDACQHTVCEDGECHDCDWRYTECGSKCHRGEIIRKES